MRDLFTFFRQFRERFETTGAILPSGRGLARAMTRALRERGDAPWRILEIGPGTGAVTREIVRQLGPRDWFDLVEINPEFGGLLEQRFQSEPAWQRVADQARVHVLPLQQFPQTAPYDLIVSGLPLNNFSPELVAELLESTWSHLKPGGSYVFFEYMYVRSIRRRVGVRSTRERLNRIEAAVQAQVAASHERTDWVFLNVPPAWARHVRRAE